LDDSIERIMLLSYVPERAHEAVLAELEPGPYDVFSRHWELEAKGEAAALQESAREVCRCLRDSPRTFAVLQRYGAHDRSESKAFVDALLDLKEVVGRRLGETVQHQRRQEEDLSRARMKSQQAAETKAAVEAEQSRARQRFEEDSATAATICSALSAEIEKHEKATQAEKALRDREADEKIKEYEKIHVETVKENEAKIAEAEAKLAVQLQEQADELLLWRRRRNKVEAELRATIEKYDVNMFQIQGEVDDLREKYDRELKEYNELAEYYAVIDQDLAIEAEEERLIKEANREADEKRARVERGIARIQAQFRGRRARSGKKKKGKKGKK
jgi:hypothetical protein